MRSPSTSHVSEWIFEVRTYHLRNLRNLRMSLFGSSTTTSSADYADYADDNGGIIICRAKLKGQLLRTQGCQRFARQHVNRRKRSNNSHQHDRRPNTSEVHYRRKAPGNFKHPLRR